ncbi:MAG: efflux RND transporter periplasmic adaptor subunit [Anaerolineaceae bacterium]|nr:efflux RND transporter periplasmic adaptor subunit [Anaerolineaceae bacterium]
MSASNTKPSAKTFRRLVTWLVLFLLAAAAVFFFFWNRQQTAQKAMNALETSEVTRQTLITSIGGTGTVRPEQLETLVWASGGHVAEGAVVLDQKVEKGRILMALSEDDLPADIIQARMDYDSIQQSLQNLAADTALQKAQLELRLSSANQSLRQMEANLADLESRVCTAWHLADLQRSYDDSKSLYEREPTQLNKNKMDLAKTNLNFCDENTIKEQTDDLRVQMETQKTNIRKDQADLDKIKNGPDPAARAKLEYQLAISEKRMQSAQLKAPFSGVVTAVYTKPGASVAPGAKAVQVADFAHYYIDVPVAEVDIPAVKLGQQADLVFDAFFNSTYHGKVKEIAKVGIEQAGVVNYNVTIEMSDGLDTIKPGMTAGVTIITDAKPNVLVVPSAAVKTLQGESVVFLLKNGAPQQVKVRVGAYSSENVEILEGDLKEGDTLVLNPPSNIMQLFTQSRRMR